jgi:uncharacterized Zn-finger protein
MKRHALAVHEGKKLFQCNICYERRNPFQCSTCNTAFTTKYYLEKHKKSFHEGKCEA